MRLDKWLKISRIIKRRSVANEAAGMGRITVNGKVAKPSTNVDTGDILDILIGGKHFICRVEKTPEFTRKEDADSLYTVVQS